MYMCIDMYMRTHTNICIHGDIRTCIHYSQYWYLQTWHQYVSEQTRRFAMLDTNNNSDPLVNDSAYMFDALWTAALALNRTETRLNERNLTLTDFTYDDDYNISNIIYEEALRVNFFGLTVSQCIQQHVHIMYKMLPKCFVIN